MNHYAKRFSALTLAVLLPLAGCTDKQSQKHSELTDRISQAVLANIGQMDAIYTLYQEGVDSCRQYLDGTMEEAVWTDTIETAWEELSRLEAVPVSQTLLDDCQESDFSAAELAVLPDIITASRIRCQNNFDFFSEFLILNKEDVPLYCKIMLDLYEEWKQEDLLSFWFATNEFMLSASDETAVNDFFEKAREYPCFQEIEIDLASSKEEAKRLQEYHLQQLERLVEDQSLLTGLMQSDNNSQREELMQLLTDELNMPQEQAQELMDQMIRVSSKEQLLDAKKQELAELQRELAELQEQMREKFAPLAGDDPGILWAKALRFAGVNMFEDAAGCLEVLKNVNDSTFTPECCEAGISFYRNAPQMGYSYGVMILMPPPEGPFAPYQAADILVSINGKPVYGADTYDALKEERQDGYQAVVLRLSAQGSLETKELTIPAGVRFYYNDLVENAGKNAS